MGWFDKFDDVEGKLDANIIMDAAKAIIRNFSGQGDLKKSAGQRETDRRVKGVSVDSELESFMMTYTWGGAASTEKIFKASQDLLLTKIVDYSDRPVHANDWFFRIGYLNEDQTGFPSTLTGEFKMLQTACAGYINNATAPDDTKPLVLLDDDLGFLIPKGTWFSFQQTLAGSRTIFWRVTLKRV